MKASPKHYRIEWKECTHIMQHHYKVEWFKKFVFITHSILTLCIVNHSNQNKAIWPHHDPNWVPIYAIDTLPGHWSVKPGHLFLFYFGPSKVHALRVSNCMTLSHRCVTIKWPTQNFLIFYPNQTIWRYLSNLCSILDHLKKPDWVNGLCLNGLILTARTWIFFCISDLCLKSKTFNKIFTMK